MAADGTAFTNSVWDEPHAEQMVYGSDGSPLGSLDWFGFESGAGGQITGNGQYIWATQQLYSGSPHCWGITRWHRNGTGPKGHPFPPANFSGGGCPGVKPAIAASPTDNILRLGSDLPKAAKGRAWHLAMQFCHNKLYLIDSNTSRMLVIDGARMAVTANVSLAPADLAIGSLACGPSADSMFVLRGCCSPPCAG